VDNTFKSIQKFVVIKISVSAYRALVPGVYAVPMAVIAPFFSSGAPTVAG